MSYFVKFCVLLLCCPCILGITKSSMINLHTAPLTWNEAYANCKRQARSLLQINEQGKQLVLQDIITKWKTENSFSETLWFGGFYYIGMDSNINGYYWSDCTAMVNYTHWVSNWTYDTSGKCVYGNLEDFSWSTALCSQQLAYFSELSTGDCYFEERGDQILSEPDLVDFSPATETACRTKCLNFSLNGNDCQAYSGNGSMCLIMVSPYIHLNSFVPSVTFNAPGVKTGIKRCYTTGLDKITPNFSPPIPISTAPNTTCSPTDPYPTQHSIGTTEITTTIKSTSNQQDTSSTTNQDTTSTINQYTTSAANQDTTSTANQDKTSTMNQDTTSSMNQGTTSTTTQDTASTTNQITTSTANQDTTSTTNQYTTSTSNQDTTDTNHDTASTTNQNTNTTTNQDTTSTTNQDTTCTTNQDTTSTKNQDTTDTTNQDTTSTTNQDTTSTTMTGASATIKKQTTFTNTTHEPNCITIQETMPENNNMIILFVPDSNSLVSDSSELGSDNQVLSGYLKCNCKTIDNSSQGSAHYQYLLINRLKLSSNRRKLTCAPDERISAISLGALGILIIILTLSVFVFSDIATFLLQNS